MYRNSSKIYNKFNAHIPSLRNSILPVHVMTPLCPASKAFPTLLPKVWHKYFPNSIDSLHNLTT